MGTIIDGLQTEADPFERGLSLLDAAEASYHRGKDLRIRVEEQGGLDIVETVDERVIQGFAASANGVEVVAFAGSNSLADWLANLDFLAVPTDRGEVHSGFAETYYRLNEGRLAQSMVRAAAERAAERGATLWLAGHSLGGALAHLAAFDALDILEDVGLVTFGQPRTIDRGDAPPVETLLRQGYTRYVNGNDLVTRVPGNLPHGGRLVPIGRGRGPIASESVGSGDGPPPLPEERFEPIRRQMQRIAENSGTTEGQTVNRTLEGLFPSIADHRIDAYRSALQERVPFKRSIEDVEPDDADWSIYPGLASTAERTIVWPDRYRGDSVRHAETWTTAGTEGRPSGDDGKGLVPAIAEDRLYPLLLRIPSADWQVPEGAVIQSRIGPLVTVIADEGAYREIRADKSVSYEASREGGGPDLDRSIALNDAIDFTKAAPTQRPEIEELGENALIGIVDTGVDIFHHAFRDEHGKTRILAIWDQTAERYPPFGDPKANRPPHAVDGTFPQTYGTVYDAAAIQEFIDGTRPTPDALRDEFDGHGTHVAGIAAGSQTGKCSAGVAPKAGLVVVIPDMNLHKNRPAAIATPNSLGYSISHVDALSFLKQLAQGGTALMPGAGKPIAINVSLGMNAGAHDGKTLLERAFDETVGHGQERGIAIVKSAGNERHEGIHTSVMPVLGRTVLYWTTKNPQKEWRTADYFEGWFGELDDLSFIVTAPNGEQTDEVSLRNRRTVDTINGNRITMTLSAHHRDNAARRLTIRIVPAPMGIHEGSWKLDIKGHRIGTPSYHGRAMPFHIWAERDAARGIAFDTPDENFTLSIPGTADHVITVGACDIHEYPAVIRASSYGPTRMGGPKPDILAPGETIVSAMANQNDPEAVVALTGTSMAAPFVTGALALALSRRATMPDKGQFDTQALKAALRRTSSDTGAGVRLHDIGFGFGPVNIRAFLDYLENEDPDDYGAIN